MMTSGEKSVHVPVLREEVIAHLQLGIKGVYVDATFGGGGHTRAILERAPRSRVIGIDRDADAIARGSALVNEFGSERLTLVNASFDRLGAVLGQVKVAQVDGVLFDLGLSSDLIADTERGFSFRAEGSLDMRFGQEGEIRAMDIVNLLDEADLISIFHTFGEEPRSRTIARALCKQREKKAFETSKQLGDCIADVVGGGYHRRHPATQVFQALRIVVNREFEQLRDGIRTAVDVLRAGGRLIVISYHSLEDRVVKTAFKELSGGCVCFKPTDLCRCPRSRVVSIVNKQPIGATPTEINKNRRARSAKMRVAERLEDQEVLKQ
jgi:16S rRNA (cytosine1402-N4)-methyltransferase